MTALMSIYLVKLALRNKSLKVALPMLILPIAIIAILLISYCL